MPDSRRTWAALAALYADNTAGAISPQDLRDGFASIKPHVASDAPTASDDETLGFDVGHEWLDTSEPAIYKCRDASTGAAAWEKVWPQDANAAAWGGITGTLSDQADLAAALSAKADAASLGTAAAANVEAFATAAQGALADTAVQPGDALTDLSSGAATAGHVPTANGSGGITWAAQTGGGGGGIAPADGLVVVQHGAVAATARPAAATVYWMGSVAPTNRVTGDLWLETDAFDGGG